MNRETWLNELAKRMAPTFESHGYPLPSFRVSIGFTSTGKGSNSRAECWHNSVSGDRVFEIFIRCDQDQPSFVAALLVHELCHAAVGFDCGHTGNFAKLMKALGMQRPFTSTVPGPQFEEWVAPLLAQLPQLPHAKLNFERTKAGKAAPIEGGEGEGEGEGGEETTAPKKQTTRLKKCTCSECGYNVRVTAKWLEIGPPHCPQHGSMQVEE